MWHDEQHRVEERMRSLFVGADANADGNLDFEEFTEMIVHFFICVCFFWKLRL